MSKAAKRERQRQNRELRREFEDRIRRRQQRSRFIRNLSFVAVPIVVIGIVISVTSGSSETKAGIKRHYSKAPAMTIDTSKSYTATIDTSEGKIIVALDAKNAPTSVNNFVFLARHKFYDGLLFNRAAKDFVIQTGGPNNTQAGGPGYTVQAELPKAPYAIGSVAWAYGGTEPSGTAGSQFFIGTGEKITTLPQTYGIIGNVAFGIDVAQKIMGFAPANGDGPLTQKVKIKHITITEAGPASTTTAPAGSTTTAPAGSTTTAPPTSTPPST